MTAPHTRRISRSLSVGLFQKHGELTNAQFCGLVGVNIHKSGKALSVLRKSGVIVNIGGKRVGRYRLALEGEIVNPPKPGECPDGIVIGAIRAMPLLESCWGGA